ncbi:MAG: hypothetical protein HYV26_20165 [Candidatus Hydrogenedentes bacterium]|nr:hypothetical protein [Candidatus Hydrogenedentota bacterium]
MAFAIGETGAGLAAARNSAFTFARARNVGESAVLSSALPSSTRPEPAQSLGFGENTLSPSGAALVTIRTTFRSAQNLVPSLEELRDELRARRAEQYAQQQERNQKLEPRQPPLGQADSGRAPSAQSQRAPELVGIAAAFRRETSEPAQFRFLSQPEALGATFNATSAPAETPVSPAPRDTVTINLLNLLI